MRHIAFCITELDDGGAERALVRVATGLHRRGRRVTVVALSGNGPLTDRLNDEGIEVTSLGLTKWNAAVALARLVRRWRRDRPDVVQTFLFHANIFGRIAARLAGVPSVCSGIRVAERRGGVRLLVDRLTDRLVDRHVCVSRSVADDAIARGGLPARKVVVIPNGVDCDSFRNAEPISAEELGLPSGTPFILWAGRLDPQKHPELAIEAFAALPPEFSETKLLMAGEGALRGGLAELIESRGLGDRVRLLGRRDDLPRLYRAARLFLLTSRWEGMPNVLLEAMAAGCPVVATDVEGVRELLGDDERGLIVGKATGSEVAARIADSLREDDASTESASIYVRDHHDWGRVVDAYDTLFSELAGADRRLSEPAAVSPD